MKNKWIIILLGIFLVGLASAATFFGGSTSPFSGATNSWQYYQPSLTRLYSGDLNSYWPILNNIQNDQCEAASDFIIGIPPGGCTPAVVRSDLLAEQNVPVFCQLYAVKINPLIDVYSIKSISFRGDYPDGVAGVSFHPARAAVRSYTTLLGDPLINNIGYVVIILKQERVEDNIEEWIAGNLTATIMYDADSAYGTGRAEYYVPVITSDAEWESTKEAYSFWKGRGYLRTRGIDGTSATIDVLSDTGVILNSYILKEGETSPVSYMSGYYCRAGLKVRLNSIESPENQTLLNVDESEIWVREGSKILNNACTVKDIIIQSKFEGRVKISCPGQTFDLEIKRLGGQSGLSDLSDANLNGAYERGTETVEELVENYRSEMKDPEVVAMGTYGEESLIRQINLAGNAGKFLSQAALIQLFLETYPESKLKSTFESKQKNLGEYNYENSYKSVHVNGRFYPISVVEFDREDVIDKKAEIAIPGYGRISVVESKEIFLGSLGTEKLLIKKIYPNRIDFVYTNTDKNAEIRDDRETIYEGETEKVGVYEITVEYTDTEEVAHISLIPEVSNTRSFANFSFQVGVEKRAIDISPEKAKEMVASLNKSIERFNEINEKLGQVIKGWKAACYATSTILMVKSAFDGTNGEAVARQKVMTEYKKICDTDPKYQGMSREECYNKIGGDVIESSVEEMAAAMRRVNNEMKLAQENNVDSSGGLFDSGSITDQKKYLEDLRGKLGNWKINLEGQELNASDLETTTQIRAALLDKELTGKTGVVYDASKTELNATLRNLALVKRYEGERNLLAQEFRTDWGVSGITANDVSYLADPKVQKLAWSGKRASDYGLAVEGVNSATKVQAIEYNGEKYLAVLGSPGVSSSEIISGIDKVYKRVNGVWTPAEKNSELSKFAYYTGNYANNECNNLWPEGKAELSYYESGQNKGLPAIVPFDLNAGWYAMVPNSGGSFLESSPQGYTASADVTYFKICNIGSNKLMESGRGDDLCQSFNVNNADDVKQFLPCPSITTNEVKSLHAKAREAIRQASSQYGSKSISIFNQVIKTGPPMSQVGGFECQDFMSVEDCKLMFNVCDPVICPSSRCDLGGKMPVTDVVQTGIIGSIALCLPNYKEGIYVPVCLTGIHAGIDSFTSILESERACLERSIQTGEHVGICDEITSIYKCEFFWKQAGPLMDFLIPKLIESTTGQSEVRGGGEYLFVQRSFDNLDKSVDYFKNVYAQNAFRAFQVRSSQDVGSEFCRAFIGTSVPSSADMLDSLLAPESPTQFYAYFSENSFSEATVPATSHYKVYYHIYAGNDQGAQYQVYLKNPPASSYYASVPRVTVKTGYIPVGESADESIDFTAPAGYKELCVVVNAQEECGFRQVTTDFGLDMIQKSYVEEQASKSDITSEKECISGSPSALPLVSPNLQSGLEESIDPEISLRGIVRICASTNPANGIGNNSRWRDVGYCGEPSLRCWLDVDSVRSDLEDLQDFTGDQISILNQSLDLLNGTRLGYEQVRKELSLINGEIESLKGEELKENNAKIIDLIFRLDNIIGVSIDTGVGTNRDKAEALSLKATIYRMIVQEVLNKKPQLTVSSDPVKAVEEAKSEAGSLNDLDKTTWGELVVGDTVYDSRNNVKLRVTKITPDGENFLEIEFVNVKDLEEKFSKRVERNEKLIEVGFTFLENTDLGQTVWKINGVDGKDYYFMFDSDYSGWMYSTDKSDWGVSLALVRTLKDAPSNIKQLATNLASKNLAEGEKEITSIGGKKEEQGDKVSIPPSPPITTGDVDFSKGDTQVRTLSIGQEIELKGLNYYEISSTTPRAVKKISFKIEEGLPSMGRKPEGYLYVYVDSLTTSEMPSATGNSLNPGSTANYFIYPAPGMEEGSGRLNLKITLDKIEGSKATYTFTRINKPRK